MTDPKTYHFTLVPASQLGPGNSLDPFRFHHNQEPVPLSEGTLRPELHLEVVDADGNRQITARDQFIYHAPDGRRLSLQGGQGLQLLNYLVDPTVLTGSSHGMIVHEVEGAPTAGAAGEISLSGIREISPSQRGSIGDRPVQFWEVDDHIDLDILEGKRVFTDAENSRWTSWRGLGIFLKGRYILRRGVLEKLAVAGIFMAGEHFANPTFMWQMYTTNFSSMVAGSVISNSRREGTMETLLPIARAEEVNDSIRRLANMRTAESRRKVAEDHAYWTLTWPVVWLACFADPNFRKFWPAPWRLPRLGMIGQYFDRQFRTAIPAISRSPLGLGAALISGFGLYEVSSAWFDIYGGLRTGTTENRVFAGGSTLLIEAAMLSRASHEMQALTRAAREVEILNNAFREVRTLPTLAEKRAFLAQAVTEAEAATGSGAINWANAAAVRRAQFQYGITVTLPEKSFLANRWANWPRIQAFFNNRSFLPTVEVGEVASHSPLGKYVLNRVGFPQFSLEARLSSTLPAAAERNLAAEVSATEALATRASAAESTLLRLSRNSGVAAELVEGREMLFVAEELVAARRVRLVGMPLLALAAGVGLGMGVGYATGYFNDDYTPRDMFREWVGR